MIPQKCVHGGLNYACVQGDSRFASLCASEEHVVNQLQMCSIRTSQIQMRCQKRLADLSGVNSNHIRNASTEVRMAVDVTISRANKKKARNSKQNLLAMLDANARFSKSNDDQCTPAHLSSPSNLLPGACPIRFLCLSAYSRAMIVQ